MTELALPQIDRTTVSKKSLIVSQLKKFTNEENVLSENEEIKPYETDGLAAYKQTPLAVVLPENTKEVSEILKFCNEENIKVIPRGAGTGLSGGALPLQDAILLGLGKFNKILEIDFDNKCVRFSAYIMSNEEQATDQVEKDQDSVITMKQLLEAGVHFGHQSSQWNPAMKEYIYGSRNGIHIIDLQKTLKSFLVAYDFVRDLTSTGKDILFVGTKKQAQEIIGEEAIKCDMPFVNSRWLGGTLTNFNTIRSRVDYMLQLKRLKDEGEFENLPKKEQISLNRELAKLEYLLNGIVNMKKMPSALFVVDTKKEDIAIKEAKKIGIPIVGVVDTNSNPNDADYIIPSNDDAIRAVKLCVEKIAAAINEGRLIYSQKVNSGQLQPEEDSLDGPIVERKAFVFKTNTAENEQEAVVYSEDNPEEKV